MSCYYTTSELKFSDWKSLKWTEVAMRRLPMTPKGYVCIGSRAMHKINSNTNFTFQDFFWNGIYFMYDFPNNHLVKARYSFPKTNETFYVTIADWEKYTKLKYKSLVSKFNAALKKNGSSETLTSLREEYKQIRKTGYGKHGFVSHGGNRTRVTYISSNGEKDEILLSYDNSTPNNFKSCINKYGYAFSVMAGLMSGTAFICAADIDYTYIPCVNGYNGKDCGKFWNFGCANILKSALRDALKFLERHRKDSLKLHSNRNAEGVRFGVGLFTYDILSKMNLEDH